MLLLVLLFVLYGCGPAAFQVELVPTRQRIEETQIQKDSGLFVFDKIAIIDVDGLLVNRRKHQWMRMGDNPVSLFIEKLDKAAADPHVKAVVLRLNSPGGTVAASDIMYHRPLDYTANVYGSATSAAGGLGPLINVEMPDWLTSSGTQFLYLWQPGIKQD